MKSVCSIKECTVRILSCIIFKITLGTALPTNLLLTPKLGALQLSWNPGFPTPTGYHVVILKESFLFSQYVPGDTISHTASLKPCVTYAIQLCARYKNLQDDRNTKYKLDDCLAVMGTPLPSPPSAPKSLKISNNPTVLGQDVEWEVPSVKRSGCELFYEIFYGPDPSLTTTAQVNGTTYRAQNLPWSTRMVYQVRARYRNVPIVGQFAQDSLVTETGPMLHIHEFSVVPTHDVLHVRWRGPINSNFYLGYGENGTTQMIRVQNSQTWSDIQVTKQCTFHTVWLAAYNSLFHSSSSFLMSKTKPQVPPPRPTNIVAQPTCGSLNVTWAQNTEEAWIQNYTVTATPVSDGSPVVETVRGNEQTALLTGLLCDKPYVVTVTAMNSCGRSQTSIPVYVMVQDRVAASPITSLSLQTDHNTLRVVWTDKQPTLVDLLYIIDLKEENASAGGIRETKTTHDKMVSFSRLTSCVSFNVSVTATNPFGQSTTSSQLTRTRPPVPQAPQNLTVSQVNRTAQNISWVADPSFPSACGLYYEIVVTDRTSGWYEVNQTQHVYFVFGDLNNSEFYTYRVRARTELEDVLSPYGEPVSPETYPSDHFSLTSIWSYVVIAGLGFICAFICFLIVVIPFQPCNNCCLKNGDKCCCHQ